MNKTECKDKDEANKEVMHEEGCELERMTKKNEEKMFENCIKEITAEGSKKQEEKKQIYDKVGKKMTKK